MLPVQAEKDKAVCVDLSGAQHLSRLCAMTGRMLSWHKAMHKRIV